MTSLATAAALLAAAVLLVPLFKKLGLGSVLGYLFAGVVIGPSVIGVVHEPETILHTAELGVTLLMFIIGLELQRERLWALRRSIFGIGALHLLCHGSADGRSVGLALDDAALATDTWKGKAEGDRKLARLYLSRMQFGYGPDESQWGQPGAGGENLYAAIDELADRLDRQVLRHKERLQVSRDEGFERKRLLWSVLAALPELVPTPPFEELRRYVADAQKYGASTTGGASRRTATSAT